METVIILAEQAQGLRLAAILRTSPLLYPVVNGLHIVGLALLFGAIAVADVTLIQRGRLDVARQGPAIALALIGFVATATTGVALFLVQAVEYAVNPAFWLKLGLIAMAGLNAALLHLAARRRHWCAAQIYARVAGSLSLMLWFSIILAGRMLAYL